MRTNFHNNTIVSPTALRAREGPMGLVMDPTYVARRIAEKIDDPNFNGDVVPGFTYRVAGSLNRDYVLKLINKLKEFIKQ
jgi:hypothetical protein